MAAQTEALDRKHVTALGRAMDAGVCVGERVVARTVQDPVFSLSCAGMCSFASQQGSLSQVRYAADVAENVLESKIVCVIEVEESWRGG